MALDYQSLLSSTNVAGYRAAAATSMPQLLKLALLQQIAYNSNPMAATDAQSLFSSTNVAGYRAAGLTSESQLLELALLSIIAGGGGGSVTSGSVDPTSTSTTGSLYLNTTTNTLWVYNGTWKMLV
jgi:hypothetical protein